MSIENNINDSNKTYKELSYSGKGKSEASKEYHKNYIKWENFAIIKHFYFQTINTFVGYSRYGIFSFEKYLDLPSLIHDEKRL